MYYAYLLLIKAIHMVTFTISELAQEFKVTTRAIRFYEDQRLLVPARDGQRRLYAQRDRARLKVILRSKRLGFSLSEIKQLFDLYDSTQEGKVPQVQFIKILAAKQAQLVEMKKDIESMLSDIDLLEAQLRRAKGTFDSETG
ncbi:MAG TPA: MerR family DNA-binding transcriptional regulator [Burkholderiales bacterium]|nr:MerR family DNA-binding transcriptional regulator [Burkholderiales bacterium]